MNMNDVILMYSIIASVGIVLSYFNYHMDLEAPEDLIRSIIYSLFWILGLAWFIIKPFLELIQDYMSKAKKEREYVDRRFDSFGMAINNLKLEILACKAKPKKKKKKKKRRS